MMNIAMLKKYNLSEKILKPATFAILIIFLFSFLLIPVEFEDVWWHIKTGEWIVENMQVPHHDPFTSIETQTPWVFTQWLGSTIYYGVYKAGGAPGLKLFRVIFFLTVIALFAFYASKRIPFSLLVPLLILMAYGLVNRTMLRPFVFNFIFIQIFLINLFSYENTSNRKNLVILPIAGMLWANLHLGSFVYGMSLIALFLASAVIEYLNLKIGKRGDNSRALHKIKELSVTLLIYPLCFLATPYGLEGFLYPFKVFLFPHFINFYKFNQVISEMAPPDYIFTLKGSWVIILIILDLACILLSKRNKFTRMLLFVSSFFFFLHGMRGSAFFTITSLYIIAECAGDISLKKKWASLKFSRQLKPALLCAIIIFLCLNLIRMFNSKIIYNNRTIKLLSLDYSRNNPIPTIQFMKNIGLSGPVFSNDKLGGYLIWSSYPQLRPFVDGRQLNQELFANHIVILRDPDKFWPIAEKQYSFQIALLDTKRNTTYRLVEYLKESPSWQLIFVDGSLLLYVKRGVFDLPKSAASFEKRIKSMPVSPEDVQILKNSVSSPTPRGIKSFFNPPPQYIHPFLEEGITLFGIGYRGQGVKYLAKIPNVTNPGVIKEVIRAVLNILQNDLK